MVTLIQDNFKLETSSLGNCESKKNYIYIFAPNVLYNNLLKYYISALNYSVYYTQCIGLERKNYCGILYLFLISFVRQTLDFKFPPLRQDPLRILTLLYRLK